MERLEKTNRALDAFLADLGLRWWQFVARALRITESHYPRTYFAMTGATGANVRSDGSSDEDSFWAAQAATVRRLLLKVNQDPATIGGLAEQGLADIDGRIRVDLRHVGVMVMGRLYRLKLRGNQALNAKLELIELEVPGWIEGLGPIFEELVQLGAVNAAIRDHPNDGAELMRERTLRLTSVRSWQCDEGGHYPGRNIDLSMHFDRNAEVQGVLRSVVDNRAKKTLKRSLQLLLDKEVDVEGFEPVASLSPSLRREIAKRCALDDLAIYDGLLKSADADSALELVANLGGKQGPKAVAASLQLKQSLATLLVAHGFKEPMAQIDMHVAVLKKVRSFLSRRNQAWVLNRLRAGTNSRGEARQSDGDCDESRGRLSDDLKFSEVEPDRLKLQRPSVDPSPVESSAPSDGANSADPEPLSGQLNFENVNEDIGDAEEFEVLPDFDDLGATEAWDAHEHLRAAYEGEALQALSAPNQLLFSLMKFRLAWVRRENGEEMICRQVVYASAANCALAVMEEELRGNNLTAKIAASCASLASNYADFAPRSDREEQYRTVLSALVDHWRINGANLDWRTIPSFELNQGGKLALTPRDNTRLKRWMAGLREQCVGMRSAATYLLRYVDIEAVGGGGGEHPT